MATTTIVGARVFGRPDDHDVVVREGLIERVEPAGSTAADGEVVDGRGHTLMPGLIDTHVHLADQSELAAAARSGVTTVVDLGTYPDSLVDSLRRTARADAVSDVISAGSAASAPGSTQISVMGFPDESGVSSPEDAERYLSWRASQGADLIKIIIEDPEATDVPALSPQTLAALVAGAHQRGLLTVAHVVTAASFARGLHAGVDILTHAPLDRTLPDDTLTGLATTGVVSSPTLIMMRTMAHARLGARAEEAFTASLETVGQLHRAGVPIIAGTDANSTPIAPVAHGSSLHDELALLRQAGLTAAETVHAATAGAAQALRLGDRGEITPGRRADLVLVRGELTDDLDTLRHPSAVWVAGRRVAGAGERAVSGIRPGHHR